MASRRPTRHPLRPLDVDYEFVGRFSEEEHRRITDVLDEVGGRKNILPGPSWSIFRRDGKAPRQFFLAVDSRAGGERCCSYYGEDLDELIEAIRAGKAKKAAD